MNEQDQKAPTSAIPKKPIGRARVKPRHLSRIVRQAIIEQFQIRQSSEDVAEELGLPVRTVTDVLLLHDMRKPIAVALRPQLVRRIA